VLGRHRPEDLLLHQAGTDQSGDATAADSAADVTASEHDGATAGSLVGVPFAMARDS
jgi:hypothetical protein